MLKRLSIALLGLFVLAAPSFGAGTVPGFSLTIQFDLTGKVAPGCQLFVIQAGTTSTPQVAYQDSALTIPSPGGSTLTCDASGRLPQFFLADGSIKFRLTDKNGVTIFTQDGLLVVGASSGGGGGSPVDPTTIMQTGHIEAFYGTGNLTGFVRLNGRTIGSATSGATERANADAQALFVFLWGVDANLAVSTGRGVSAAADWAANKTIALPDFRSRALAGLGDMGNSDNALFSGVTFTSGNSTTLGSRLGAARTTLLATNVPPLTSVNASQSITVGLSGGVNNLPGSNGTWSGIAVTPPVAGASFAPFSTNAIANVTTLSGPNSISVTSQGTNSTAFDTASPYGLITIYVKL